MNYMKSDRTTDNWKRLSFCNEKDTIVSQTFGGFWISLQMVTVLLNHFHIFPQCLHYRSFAAVRVHCQGLHIVNAWLFTLLAS